MRSLPLLLLAACASPPPPWQAPTAVWQVTEVVDLGANPSPAGRTVTVALHAVPTTPTGEPLASEVELVAAEQQQPFRGAAPTAGWLRLPDGPLPQDHQPVATTVQPLRRATTTRFATGLAALPSLELRLGADDHLPAAQLGRAAERFQLKRGQRIGINPLQAGLRDKLFIVGAHLAAIAAVAVLVAYDNGDRRSSEP